MKDEPFCLLGKLKMLKPFKFVRHGKWSDGFEQHGIFEIIGKRGRVERPDDPQCDIRRIATCRFNCPLDERKTFPESYLTEYTVPTSLDAFKEEPDLDPLNKPSATRTQKGLKEKV